MTTRSMPKALACVAIICATIHVTSSRQIFAAAVDLFVSGTFSFPETSVKGFDGATGMHYGVDGTGAFASGGGLSFPRGLTFGLDGHLYVSSEGTDNVLKYDGTSGAFLSEFVAAGAGGLSTPKGLAFAPDGKLYVAGYDLPMSQSDVFRFDGTTGAFIDRLVDFIPPMVSYGTPWGVTVGPDGNIYFTNVSTLNVMRFVPATSTLSEFIGIAAMGANTPHGLTFGPDGDLYVSTTTTSKVLKFNGTTGALIGTFVASGSGGLSSPDGLKFGPDGNLYVSSNSTNSVLRYSGADGSFLDVFATLPFPHPFGPGDLEFHAVPEPSAVLLGCLGAVTMIALACRCSQRTIQ